MDRLVVFCAENAPEDQMSALWQLASARTSISAERWASTIERVVVVGDIDEILYRYQKRTAVLLNENLGQVLQVRFARHLGWAEPCERWGRRDWCLIPTTNLLSAVRAAVEIRLADILAAMGCDATDPRPILPSDVIHRGAQLPQAHHRNPLEFWYVPGTSWWPHRPADELPL